MAVILETLRLRSLLAFALLLVAILIIFFVVGGKIGLLLNYVICLWRIFDIWLISVSRNRAKLKAKQLHCKEWFEYLSSKLFTALFSSEQ